MNEGNDKEEDYRKQPCNQGNGADTVLRPFVTNIRSSITRRSFTASLVPPLRGSFTSVHYA